MQHLTRLFEILIKDSFKRSKRHSRSSSQAPRPAAPPSPGAGEARFARLIQQHQQYQQHQQQRLALARNGAELEAGRDVTVDGQRYRIARSRSPMEIDTVPDRETRMMRALNEETRVPSPVPSAREEDKEEEGTSVVVDNMEIGLGTVVIA